MAGADIEPRVLARAHWALFSCLDSFSVNEPAPSAEKVAMDVPSCASLPSLTSHDLLFLVCSLLPCLVK